MAESKVVYTNNSSEVMYANGQHFWAGSSVIAPRTIPSRSSVTTQQRASAAGGAFKFASEYIYGDAKLPTARKFIVAFDMAVPQEDGPYGSELPRNYSMILGPGESIKEIIVRHGFVVDAIGFVVADKTGKTTTKMFGGNGGSITRITLRNNEYITQVSGTYGPYRHFGNQTLIAAITIHTNLNTLGYGPYGRPNEVSNPRRFASASGSIVGFFGKHSHNLESVGIYTREGATKEDGPYGSASARNYSLTLGPDERIQEVIVRHGFIVDAIGFVVADKYTGRTDTKIFGGNGGSETKIPLEDDEYLTQISGVYGNYRHFGNQILIASLTIHTNLNPRGYGAYGRPNEVSNRRSFQCASTSIVGFFGRHNNNLESLGIYVRIGASKDYGPYGSQLERNYLMILAQDETIKEVIVRHGFIVDAIGFVIADRNGNTSTKMFGGNSGNNSRILLKSDEFITQISGTHGQYGPHKNTTLVGRLIIHTNLNPRGYGPYGRAEQVKNPRNFESGIGRIDAFFGRHHNTLESIGVNLTINFTNKVYAESGPVGPTDWNLVEAKLGQSESSDVFADNDMGSSVEVKVDDGGDATVIFNDYLKQQKLASKI